MKSDDQINYSKQNENVEMKDENEDFEENFR